MNERSRLLWQCRRGIREMDILFRDFIDQHYDQLSDDEKQIGRASCRERV